jgi:hypothetical protein
VPEIEDFTISPRQAEVKAAGETRKRRDDIGIIAKLITSGALEEGTPLTLRPYGINEDLRSQLDAHLRANPLLSQAIWVNDEKGPIRWAFDGEQYLPTTLPRNLLREATGDGRTLRGGDWWVTEEGKSLVELSKFEWTETEFRVKLADSGAEPL